MIETFGEVISTYTRAQAIEDGLQVNVTGTPASTVYKVDVFMTAALWAEVTRGAGKDAEVRGARMWDVAWMASRGREDGPCARTARVKVGRRVLTVRAECGPVDFDDPRPAITLGLPNDF